VPAPSSKIVFPRMKSIPSGEERYVPRHKALSHVRNPVVPEDARIERASSRVSCLQLGAGRGAVYVR
jgi:hypothetical protein